MAGGIDAVAALREIAFLLERSNAETYRVRAFRRAAESLAALPAGERELRSATGAWEDVDGLGPKTIGVIRQAIAGQVPDYLTRLRGQVAPLTEGGQRLHGLLRGDLHTHTDASDGGASLEEMVAVARAAGLEYTAITDHSPRLAVANGLSAERLAAQGEQIDDLNSALAPFRVLKGIEVDILDDGSLDQEPEALARLDVVVASVHSKLSMESAAMTRRMVQAISNPRTNVLGHCTGRLITGSRGTRPESTFEAEVVFEACRVFGVAVEINSRPERRDPPTRLLELARDMGCLFAIDTDAHAPGQVDFSWYGCERAEAAGIEPERIVNTWPLDQLLAFCSPGRRSPG